MSEPTVGAFNAVAKRIWADRVHLLHHDHDEKEVVVMKAKKLRSAVPVDPTGLYPTPQALAADESLTRTERILRLRQWEHAEHAKGISTGNGQPETLESWLRELVQARKSLEDHGERGLLTRRDETEPARSEGRPEAAAPPSAPVPEPLDSQRRSPRGSTLSVLAALFLALIGIPLGLATHGGDIAVSILMLSLIILLIVFLSHRPQPGPRP